LAFISPEDLVEGVQKHSFLLFLVDNSSHFSAGSRPTGDLGVEDHIDTLVDLLYRANRGTSPHPENIFLGLGILPMFTNCALIGAE
jgi:hypothetical protein